MYAVPAKCPVCEGDLYAERLACMECGTAIEGEFVLQRLARLTPEQWAFVELFIRSEGKLNRLQEELDLSYPTVRNRLNEVIRALGYEVGGQEEAEGEERQEVLDQLSQGAISLEQALKRLRKQG
ncbi:MAG: DUF2089 domain-containing protein [Anaerolineales bacterium]